MLYTSQLITVYFMFEVVCFMLLYVNHVRALNQFSLFATTI